MNSVPLSERILFGFPLHSIHCDKTSIGYHHDDGMFEAAALTRQVDIERSVNSGELDPRIPGDADPLMGE
jgi:hypothetical protein